MQSIDHVPFLGIYAFILFIKEIVQGLLSQINLNFDISFYSHTKEKKKVALKFYSNVGAHVWILIDNANEAKI